MMEPPVARAMSCRRGDPFDCTVSSEPAMPRVGAARRRIQGMATPPLGRSTCPVTNFEASLAR